PSRRLLSLSPLSRERRRRLCSWDDLRVDRSRGRYSAALVAVRIARRGRSGVFYSPRHQTSWVCVNPREVLISFFVLYIDLLVPISDWDPFFIIPLRTDRFRGGKPFPRIWPLIFSIPIQSHTYSIC